MKKIVLVFASLMAIFLISCKNKNQKSQKEIFLKENSLITNGQPINVRTNNFGYTLKNKLKVGIPKNNPNTLLPEDLPKEFFGNWYDKYGTLMLITTRDFIVSNINVSFYQNIQKTGDNAFTIIHSGGYLEILKISKNSMVTGGERLNTLSRKPIDNSIPSILKGTWKNKNNTIIIEDDSIYFDGKNNPYIFGSKKLKVVHVASSKHGDLFWLILYNEGNHHIYIAHKIDNEYLLSPRGWNREQYIKVE